MEQILFFKSLHQQPEAMKLMLTLALALACVLVSPGETNNVVPGPALERPGVRIFQVQWDAASFPTNLNARLLLARHLEDTNVVIPSSWARDGLVTRSVAVLPDVFWRKLKKETPPKKDEAAVDLLLRHLKENKVEIIHPAAVLAEENRHRIIVHAKEQDARTVEYLINMVMLVRSENQDLMRR